MADNKKAFMLYHDSKNVWDKMSNERAGILIKSIFSYKVNGIVPSDLEERGLDLIMESLICQFKRDDEKWENRANASRENGKAGGRPRKNPENPTGYLGSNDNLDNQPEPKEPVIGKDSVTVIGKDNKLKKDSSGMKFDALKYFDFKPFSEEECEALKTFIGNRDAKGNPITHLELPLFTKKVMEIKNSKEFDLITSLEVCLQHKGSLYGVAKQQIKEDSNRTNGKHLPAGKFKF